jgi:hypothetical protein
MLFSAYKDNFDTRRAALRFSSTVKQLGGNCIAKSRPAMPPWIVDWAVLYSNGFHLRVKEYFVSKSHPHFDEGERKHFSYQYGVTSDVDEKGMPRTLAKKDNVIRLELDRTDKPHMHLGDTDHIYQEDLTGTFVINNIELFEFVEAVETHRQSALCPFEEIFLFGLKKGGGK